MFRCLSSLRFYSTSGAPKPSIKLVAELRKATDVSITKAREALIASNNEVAGALKWLQKNLLISGAQQAAKVAGRDAKEGLIGLSVLARGCGEKHWGLRAAMVELNCETDFVAKNDLFKKLASDIAQTAAFVFGEHIDSKTVLAPCSLQVLNDAPLMTDLAENRSPSSQTVADAVRELIAKVGEKIFLRRAMVAVRKQVHTSPTVGYRLASYAHGSGGPLQGRMGTLAILGLHSTRLLDLLQEEDFVEKLGRLERSLARQIVGFQAQRIQSHNDTIDNTALYNMPFMMFDGAEGSVANVLQTWSRQTGMIEERDGGTGGYSIEHGGIHVLEFMRWTVGEPETAVDISQ